MDWRTTNKRPVHRVDPVPALATDRQAIAVLPKTVARVPLRDLADEIERAKNRRITPSRYEAELGQTAPLPAAEMARLFGGHGFEPRTLHSEDAAKAGHTPGPAE
jgi:hypothetical protein